MHIPYKHYLLRSLQITSLFENHVDLLEKFQDFLPRPASTITGSTSAGESSENYNIPWEDILKNVKITLDNPSKYREFCDCLHKYSREEIDHTQLQILVCTEWCFKSLNSLFMIVMSALDATCAISLSIKILVLYMRFTSKILKTGWPNLGGAYRSYEGNQSIPFSWGDTLWRE